MCMSPKHSTIVLCLSGQWTEDRRTLHILSTFQAQYMMYDGVLKLSLQGQSRVVGFADDAALVGVVKKLLDTEATPNEATA